MGKARRTRTVAAAVTAVAGIALIGPATAGAQTVGEIQMPEGYWVASWDGVVAGWGDAEVFEPVPDDWIVDISSGAPTWWVENDEVGGAEPMDEPMSAYWLLGETGLVHSRNGNHYGEADQEVLHDDEYHVAIAVRPQGDGYWVVTSMGRVFAYGEASDEYGDLSGLALNQPIVDAVSTWSGEGFYLVAADGGVFNFGDAEFSGSTGAMTLNEPVMGILPDWDGGYWLVAADGGVFSFDAEFHGSLPGLGIVPNEPVMGLVRHGEEGYVMAGADGGIFNFSDKEFLGSLVDEPLDHPIVAIASMWLPLA